MKKYVIIIITIIACGLVSWLLIRDKQVEIIYDSDVVVIDNIEIHTPESKLSASMDTSGAQQLFVKYFTASSAEGYHELFLDGEPPNLSGEEFRAWQEYLSRGNLSILGIVNFSINGQVFSLVQYTLESVTEKTIAGLLIKSRDKRFFPCSKQEIDRYRGIKRMLERHKLESLNHYLHSDSALSKLDLSYIRGIKSGIWSINVDGDIYISSLEKLLLSEEPESRQFAKSVLYPAMQIRKQKKTTDGDFENKIKIYKDYLSSIDCSEETQALLIEMIMDGDYLGSAMRIRDHLGEPSVHDSVLKIREIFGENVIYGTK